jgi:hypothetical protein
LNLRPLGYEPYDARLRVHGWSPVTALTSTEWPGAFVWAFYVSPVSICPAASCAQIRAQSRFLTCGFPCFQRARPAHTPACRFIPSPSAHPPGSGPGPTGQGGAPNRRNDLDPWGLVCSACLGRWRQDEPAPDLHHSRSCSTFPSILEPEVPAGGVAVVMGTRRSSDP